MKTIEDALSLSKLMIKLGKNLNKTIISLYRYTYYTKLLKSRHILRKKA
jgi:hypothetical protein